MSKKEKLIQRFLSNPMDFTFDEMVKLFSIFGFEISNKGATSGSRVSFWRDIDNLSYTMHKPHPGKVIKPGTMKDVRKFFDKGKFIDKFNSIK